MAHPHILTFADAIKHGADFLGGEAGAYQHGLIRSAVQSSYRELVDSRLWTYLRTFHRVNTETPYSTGTVEYDHTGGSSENLVTLTSGTFPSWVSSRSYIRISGKWHKVESRLGNTTLQLDSTINPGSDVAAGTAFKVMQSLYQLPANFACLDIPTGEDRWMYGRDDRPNEFLARPRFGEGQGFPFAFDIVGDPISNNYGRMALFTLEETSAAQSLDLFYYRRPRELKISGYEPSQAGTATTASSSTTVTGVTKQGGGATVWSSALAGAYIRFYNTSAIPTNIDGIRPYVEQGIVSSVGGATSITLTAAASQTLTAVGFIISDPVDLDVVMYDAFLRGIERKLCIYKNVKNKGEYEQLYAQAFQQAAAKDAARNFSGRQQIVLEPKEVEEP